MSGAASDTTEASTQPNGALSNGERVDVRRFCGYPAYGTGNGGFQNWRFFQAYGTLEYRLTNAAPEEFQQIRQYLGQLIPLEQALLTASSGFDTSRAAIYTRNPNEMIERNALFRQWRSALCEFLGIPPGPALAAKSNIII